MSILIKLIFINLITVAQVPPPTAPNSDVKPPPVQSMGNSQAEYSDENLRTAMESFYEEFVYDPSDKRDPFTPLTPFQKQNITTSDLFSLDPLQNYPIEQLSLKGIIWSVLTPKALIKDPSGDSHIVVENAKIGKNNGYIASIREGEVVIVESITDQQGRKKFQTATMKIREKK